MSKIEVNLISVHGDDEKIANAAWTSYYSKEGKVKKTKEQAEALVKLLAEEGHHLPFEHTQMTFHIKMPVAISRQMMTHRVGVSSSNMSGRYRTMPSVWLDIPNDVFDILSKIPSYGSQVINDYRDICTKANDLYTSAVSSLKEGETMGNISNTELKRAREFIRGMLPQHNMVESVTTFNLRSLAHFVKLRDKPNAQPEIQFIAKEMVRLLKEIDFCPVAMQYLFV